MMVITVIFFLLVKTFAYKEKPNILLVIGDDIGKADVGYYNPDISTPNLDTLAKEGIVLENFYVHPTCTASRGALLMSRYSHELNLTIPYTPRTPMGLEKTHPSIADALKLESYETYFIGKWHLGHSKSRYLPDNFGFDHYYGFMNGAFNHYSHMVYTSLDLWENGKQVSGSHHEGIHSSRLFVDKALKYLEQHNTMNPYFMILSFAAAHDPLQVEESFLEKCHHLNQRRKKFCAMMVGMDYHLGRLLEHVSGTNTVVIYMSDNGGNPFAGGFNYPLRGMKTTSYQGGVVVPAFIHGLGQGTYGELTHVVDLYPTILSIVHSRQCLDYSIQGIDMELENLTKPHRNQAIVWIDPFAKHASIVANVATLEHTHQYKLMVGKTSINTVITENNKTYGNMGGSTIITLGGTMIDLMNQLFDEITTFRLNYLTMFLTMCLHDYIHDSSTNLITRLQNNQRWLDIPLYSVNDTLQLFDLTVDPYESSPFYDETIVELILNALNQNIKSLYDQNKTSLYCGDEQAKEMKMGQLYDDKDLESFTRSGGYFVNIWKGGIVVLYCISYFSFSLLIYFIYIFYS